MRKAGKIGRQSLPVKDVKHGRCIKTEGMDGMVMASTTIVLCPCFELCKTQAAWISDKKSVNAKNQPKSVIVSSYLLSKNNFHQLTSKFMEETVIKNYDLKHHDAWRNLWLLTSIFKEDSVITKYDI